MNLVKAIVCIHQPHPGPTSQRKKGPGWFRCIFPGSQSLHHAWSLVYLIHPKDIPIDVGYMLICTSWRFPKIGLALNRWWMEFCRTRTIQLWGISRYPQFRKPPLSSMNFHKSKIPAGPFSTSQRRSRGPDGDAFFSPWDSRGWRCPSHIWPIFSRESWGKMMIHPMEKKGDPIFINFHTKPICESMHPIVKGTKFLCLKSSLRIP